MLAKFNFHRYIKKSISKQKTKEIYQSLQKFSHLEKIANLEENEKKTKCEIGCDKCSAIHITIKINDIFKLLKREYLRSRKMKTQRKYNKITAFSYLLKTKDI